MSSDPPSRPATDPRSSLRGFRRVAGATIVVLVLAAAGLSAANARQGPRLLSSEVNLPATVQRSGQRLLLRTDQPVIPVTEQVVVTPEVPFEVRSDRSDVVLRFGAPLHYATTYDVVVPVRSVATGMTSTLRYSLRTADATMYLLQRAGTDANAGPDDEVIRTTTVGTDPQVVHRGSRIQEFAVAEPSMAVITQDGAEGATLSVAPLDQSAAGRLVSSRAMFSQLKSSGPGGMFGYLVGPLDPADQESPRLELYDSTTGQVIPVEGVDGLPLAPADWAFIPGTKSLVVQTDDSSLFVVDPVGGALPVPLGGHERIHGFTSGTAQLTVEDQGQYTTIDLTSGTTSAIPVTLDDVSVLDYLVSPAGGRAKVGLQVRTDDTSTRYSVVRLGRTKNHPLYTPEAPDSWISQLCMSPNGDYLAVETVPGDAATDDYIFAPGYQGATTVIIELATERRSPALAGFGSNWCS